MRWDNAPHHRSIATFPNHKHDCNKKIIESKEITINEVIKIIETKIVY
ncbi:MAG: hypothetical protein KAI79_12275 [Bacteroidales bacterium]|nr:hypothetical protein [Bacteroidales bacterium]